MNHPTAILFDAGGTLIVREPSDDLVLLDRWHKIGLAVDLAQAHRAARRSDLWVGEQVQREVTGAPRMPDEQFFREVDRAGLRAVFATAAEPEVECWLDRLQALPKVERSWKAVPAARKVLETFQARGTRMAVVSNFNPTLPGILDRLGLAPFFETIVCSQVVGIEKPNPEILRIALQQMRVSPQDAVYVGDFPLDVLCANQAGMAAVWLREAGDTLPPSFGCRAEYEIEDLAELVNILP